MTYKEKLTKLLKEVPEIKNDLEELRFGCKIEYDYAGKIIDDLYVENMENGFMTLNSHINDDEYKVIGNPLSEHHLRLYIEATNYRNEIQKQMDFSHFILINLDSTKDFNNQSEEVYKKIFNYLTNQKLCD